MKLIHKLGKHGKYYTALASQGKDKIHYDFDPFKIGIALVCFPQEVRELLEALQLDFPSELLRVSHEWEIELF